jgi:osmotically-inducible protein OsmY
MSGKSLYRSAAAMLGAALMFAAITASAEMATSAQNAGEVIAGKIAATLAADSKIDGTGIQVSTSRGVVSLSGKVETVAMIYRAVELARCVDGVQGVNDDALIQANY